MSEPSLHQPSGSEAEMSTAFSVSPASREAPEHVPISYLNALIYCPRRFYYEYAQGEMLVNEHVLQGRVNHRNADSGGARIVDETLSLRQVYVYSDRLRISGLIDVVEVPLAPDPTPNLAADATTDSLDVPDASDASDVRDVPDTDAPPYPVEYKKGSPRGGGANDQVQLCAQGMCLEERIGRTVRGGYIFSASTRRRTWVAFTPELRAQTEATIARAFALLRAGCLPPPLPAEQDRKCRDCSLEPLCLPREVRALTAVPRLGSPAPSRGPRR